jgi:PAS domain S-box-containing protein
LKALANPILLRMALLMGAAVFAFVVGTLLVRRLRRKLTEEGSIDTAEPVSLESLPLHTYNAVIQELKQQKYQLQNTQQEERRRAKTSENISAAVLANLSSGVLFVNSNGLVRQANTAARQILGFAAPVGMGLTDIFNRAATIVPGRPHTDLAETLLASVREKTAFERMEVRYRTPAGEERVLDLNVTSVNSLTGETLGAACLINDLTELASIRRQGELRGEMSAEMALELRGSLSTIADCARRLAESPEPDSARQLATDISSEAAHLDHTIGGFLAGARNKANGAAAGI